MSAIQTISHRDQRILLRARLLLQRGVIRERLHPELAMTPEFPRSRTLRLLMQHPQIGTGLVVAAGVLWLRPQWIRQWPWLLGAIRFARSAIAAAR